MMTLDMETEIRTQLAKPADQREAELRKAIENIQIVAKAFGSRGDVQAHERCMFSLAALDTINRLAAIALTGVTPCSEPSDLS